MADEYCGNTLGIRYGPSSIERPQIQQTSQWYPITIRKVTNGFIVEVGCRTFVKENWRDVVEGITKYWKDPMEAEKEYCSKP